MVINIKFIGLEDKSIHLEINENQQSGYNIFLM